MTDRQLLIDKLSNNLPPVRPATAVNRLALIWLLLSGLYVIAVTHFFGPLRPTALEQLATQPRFLAETLLGLVALTLAALVGFRAAIPGALSHRLRLVATLLLCGWVGCYLFGLFSPALEPSMLGKRPHCVVETFLFALAPLALALLLARRLFALQPGRAALWLGLTAGLLPALYMQLACMYVPEHILKFHIAPGLAVAVLAVPLGWLILRGRDKPVL
jgi:hypothetical protein